MARGLLEAPVDVAARRLLGAYIVRSSAEGECIGRIVETEAYAGPDDRASHARAGQTRRTMPMFGEVGRAYVYLVYGLHECLNVVAHPRGEAGAVLLRAIEPLSGIELMRARRNRADDAVARLAAGPARLCQALAVSRAFNGHDLLEPGELWLAEPTEGERRPATEVCSGPRIGVAYAGAEWAAREWRYWLPGTAALSQPPRRVR